MYLVVSQITISLALIKEENRVQKPVYYTRQAFQDAEAKYPYLEKVSFALIVASRKLHPYFLAQPIIVMTDQPIKKAMSKPDTTGRLVQWAIKLNQFDVEYRPRLAIKAQVLADFIVEFTFLGDDQTQF